MRRKRLRKLRHGKRYYDPFAAFERALDQVSAVDEPMQVFVSITPEPEAHQDALYVHTPNPNGRPFPHSFEGVRWDVIPPPSLRAFVEGQRWQTGGLSDDPRCWWVVRPRPGRAV